MIAEKFLIDANSFISAGRFFYAVDIVPSFWPLFKNSIQKDNVTIMDVVRNEVLKGDDFVSEWLRELDNINILKRDDANVLGKYQDVMRYLHTSGYYTVKAQKAWVDFDIADPWLIAAGAAYGYTIVTFEQSAGVITLKNPSSKPKIPDIARNFGVKCEDLYYFMRAQQIQI